MQTTTPPVTFDPAARGPIHGVRILDLSRLVAGNMLSLQLAPRSQREESMSEGFYDRQFSTCRGARRRWGWPTSIQSSQSISNSLISRYTPVGLHLMP